MTVTFSNLIVRPAERLIQQGQRRIPAESFRVFDPVDGGGSFG
jgi:hypothetical protein